MAVTIVTDSSAGLCGIDKQKWGIGEVPLHIIVDGHNLRDGVDDVPADIYDNGDATTAGATPAELSAEYSRALADSGGDGVVAVHISAALSSTVTAADQAARQFSGAVRVVNSKSAAMGTGFVALAAARAAAAGADLDTVEAAARAETRRVKGYIVVQRLENLRRSGRIGTAASWLSTALSIKPVLRIDPDGRLVLAQRVRTATKALAALIELLVDEVGDAPVEIAVHHVANKGLAAELADALTNTLTVVTEPRVTELGPVLGVHVGAGAIAVVVDAQQ